MRTTTHHRARCAVSAVVIVMLMPAGGHAQARGSANPVAHLRAAIGKKPASRPDPFAPTWSVQTSPAPVLSRITPIRIAARDHAVSQDGPIVEMEVGSSRRMTGLLIDGGVEALMEGPDGALIVRPGDRVGDYVVRSIQPHAVTLRRRQGDRTLVERVKLTDRTGAEEERP